MSAPAAVYDDRDMLGTLEKPIKLDVNTYKPPPFLDPSEYRNSMELSLSDMSLHHVVRSNINQNNVPKANRRNFRESYEQLTYRYQTEGQSMGNRDGDPQDLLLEWDHNRNFFHWTMFPVVRRSGTKDNRSVTIVPYIVIYSSDPATNTLGTGRMNYENWSGFTSGYRRGVQNRGGNMKVDTRFVDRTDVHAIASIYAAIQNSSPLAGTYLTIVPWIDQGVSVSPNQNMTEEYKFGGASLGMAVFAAITGMPTAFYTGYLKYIHPNMKFATNTNEAAQLEFLAKQGDLHGGTPPLADTTRVMLQMNMIEPVSLIPVKTAYAIAHNTWPLIIPNNTGWQKSAEYVIEHQHVKQLYVMWLGITAALYTSAKARTMPYSNNLSPLLVAMDPNDASDLIGTALAVRYGAVWRGPTDVVNPQLNADLMRRAANDNRASVVYNNQKLMLRITREAIEAGKLAPNMADATAISNLAEFIGSRTRGRTSKRGDIIRAGRDWAVFLKEVNPEAKYKRGHLRSTVDAVLERYELPPIRPSDSSIISGSHKLEVLKALDPGFGTAYQKRVIQEYQNRHEATKRRFMQSEDVKMRGRGANMPDISPKFARYAHIMTAPLTDSQAIDFAAGEERGTAPIVGDDPNASIPYTFEDEFGNQVQPQREQQSPREPPPGMTYNLDDEGPQFVPISDTTQSVQVSTPGYVSPEFAAQLDIPKERTEKQEHEFDVAQALRTEREEGLVQKPKTSTGRRAPKSAAVRSAGKTKTVPKAARKKPGMASAKMKGRNAASGKMKAAGKTKAKRNKAAGIFDDGMKAFTKYAGDAAKLAEMSAREKGSELVRNLGGRLNNMGDSMKQTFVDQYLPSPTLSS